MALKPMLIPSVLLALCWDGTASTQARSGTGGRHANAGSVRDYPHARVVKLVFDLNSVSPTPADTNPGLIAIGDLMRHYASLGKDSPRLDVVVVLHGKTTEVALDTRSSATRLGGVANGSIDEMRSLAAKGVQFVVSRQSLSKWKINEKEVLSFVRLGPSAEIVFLDLEAAGYIFDGTTSLGGD